MLELSVTSFLADTLGAQKGNRVLQRTDAFAKRNTNEHGRQRFFVYLAHTLILETGALACILFVQPIVLAKLHFTELGKLEFKTGSVGGGTTHSTQHT